MWKICKQMRYFSNTALNHMKPQQGLSERYLRRAIDVALAAKLTLTYGKYHLAMLHRQLAMSEERATYQQAERSAAMMNQMTIFHSSPADFMHTQEESTDESIATHASLCPESKVLRTKVRTPAPTSTANKVFKRIIHAV